MNNKSVPKSVRKNMKKNWRIKKKCTKLISLSYIALDKTKTKGKYIIKKKKEKFQNSARYCCREKPKYRPDCYINLIRGKAFKFQIKKY